MSSSGSTILESSIQKHNNGKNSATSTPVASKGGLAFFNRSNAVHPINEDQASEGWSEDNHSQEEQGSDNASDVHSESSKNQFKASFNNLAVEDVICIIHSVMDLGITAPLTSAILKMSNIVRAQIISKFMFHLLSSQEKR
jgi:hypothetical protein|tara:strand:- start:1279 stop:1701 length:423 start_codon:yes stop_codon:yes gene_type:complete